MTSATTTPTEARLPGLEVEAVEPQMRPNHWLERGNPKRLMVFAGRSHPDLATRIAEHLGVELGEIEVGTFANGISPVVNLVQPGSLYGDRVNELDFKIAKIVRFHGTRLNAGLEIYNALNANAVLTYAQNFSTAVQSGPGAWLQPTQVMTPRFFKLTAQFDF